MTEENFNPLERYTNGSVSGWTGKDEAEKAWESLQKLPNVFSSVHTALKQAAPNKKMMLYEVVRKVLGKDTENYAQKTGDCVSFGMKNAIEYLQCSEILLNDKNHKFRPIFAPYLYHLCRVKTGVSVCLIPGSSGGAMAEGVLKYGSIYSDESGVPKYSGLTASWWGCRISALKVAKYLSVGQKNLIGSAAKVNNWEELVTAITNGYPCTVASNQGFKQSPDSDGYHKASGRWAHQMCIIGVGTWKGEDYCIILNSWGDAMGRLKDFDNPSIDLPIGVIRARRSEIEKSMIAGGEVYAISKFGNLQDNASRLEKELFSQI
jgi:hypothetical protein